MANDRDRRRNGRNGVVTRLTITDKLAAYEQLLRRWGDMGEGSFAQQRRYLNLLASHETRLWNAVEQALVRAGAPLTMGRLRVMEVIRDTRPARVQDVADGVLISVSAASRLVDRLVCDGLVSRGANAADRRSSELSLSPAGTEALVESATKLEQVLPGLVTCLDQQRMEHLSAELARADARLCESLLHQGGRAGGDTSTRRLRRS